MLVLDIFILVEGLCSRPFIALAEGCKQPYSPINRCRLNRSWSKCQCVCHGRLLATELSLFGRSNEAWVKLTIRPLCQGGGGWWGTGDRDPRSPWKRDSNIGGYQPSGPAHHGARIWVCHRRRRALKNVADDDVSKHDLYTAGGDAIRGRRPLWRWCRSVRVFLHLLDREASARSLPSWPDFDVRVSCIFLSFLSGPRSEKMRSLSRRLFIIINRSFLVRGPY